MMINNKKYNITVLVGILLSSTKGAGMHQISSHRDSYASTDQTNGHSEEDGSSASIKSPTLNEPQVLTPTKIRDFQSNVCCFLEGVIQKIERMGKAKYILQLCREILQSSTFNLEDCIINDQYIELHTIINSSQIQ